jgi:hypothetical protein
MGADFILCHCEFPRLDDLATHQLVEHRINNLSQSTLDSIADDILFYEATEIENKTEHSLKEEELFNLDELIKIKIREMVKEHIKEAANELLRFRRDTWEEDFSGILYLFTGGMSWGDQPTDAVQHINLVEYSGIFKGMGHLDFDYGKAV